MADAGVVDENVDAAEFLKPCRDRGLDVRLLGDVGDDGKGPVAEFLGHALGAGGIAVDDDDLGAALDKALRNALAETRARAGDESDLTF
ncbi:hypothetical protein D3C72_1982530 [compost metagenome]